MLQPTGLCLIVLLSPALCTTSLFALCSTSIFAQPRTLPSFALCLFNNPLCGESVDLPQIVEVGDQSSGKSSVFEGLTKKPLLRDSGLCTRFAAQIVFRRSTEEEITVSFLPDSSASQNIVIPIAWRYGAGL